MVQTAYATADDLAYRWRPLSPFEQTRAEVLLDDAANMLRGLVPGLDARIESGALSVGAAVAVSCAMVRRVMAAEDAPVTQQTDVWGPFSHSQSFGSPSGDMYATRQELRQLGAGRRIGMIDLIPNPGQQRR